MVGRERREVREKERMCVFERGKGREKERERERERERSLGTFITHCNSTPNTFNTTFSLSLTLILLMLHYSTINT